MIDRDWNSYEEKRFLKDGPKAKTEDFEPESFKHDGFSDHDTYLETYVPALADPKRLAVELNDFTPPRLKDRSTEHETNDPVPASVALLKSY